MELLFADISLLRFIKRYNLDERQRQVQTTTTTKKKKSAKTKNHF